MESSRLTLHTQGFRSDPMSHGTQAGCSLSLVSLQLLLKSESYWHVKSFGVRWWDCLSARVIVLETEPQRGCGSSRIKRCHCKALTFGHMSCGADINTISTSIFEPKGQKIRSAPPHPVFHGMILPMLTLVQEGINVLYEETVWSGISEVSWISKIIKERCELKERSSVTDKKFGIQLLHMSPEPTQK